MLGNCFIFILRKITCPVKIQLKNDFAFRVTLVLHWTQAYLYHFQWLIPVYSWKIHLKNIKNGFFFAAPKFLPLAFNKLIHNPAMKEAGARHADKQIRGLLKERKQSRQKLAAWGQTESRAELSHSYTGLMREPRRACWSDPHKGWNERRDMINTPSSLQSHYTENKGAGVQGATAGILYSCSIFLKSQTEFKQKFLVTKWFQKSISY